MSNWIAPVTNRSNGTARMTYMDMIRITGNLAFLYDLIESKGGIVPGSKISKTVWTQYDIITVADWAELLTCLANICSAVGYVPPTAPTNALTYSNVNNIETITLMAYEYAEILDRLERMNHYIGDPIYSGDPVNAGGLYD